MPLNDGFCYPEMPFITHAFLQEPGKGFERVRHDYQEIIEPAKPMRSPAREHVTLHMHVYTAEFKHGRLMKSFCI